MSPRLLLLAVIALLAYPVLALRAGPLSGEEHPQLVQYVHADPASAPFVPGRLLAKPRTGLFSDQLRVAAADAGATLLQDMPELGLQVLSVEPGNELEASRQLDRSSSFLWAEPDYLVRIHDLPPGPMLTSPTAGTQLGDFSPALSWANAEGSRAYQLQVSPANNDGPGINLIASAATGFKVPPPPQWYGLLPDMTYSWRVRLNPTTSWGENDAGWGAWSEPRTFRTPAATAATIQPVAPTTEAAQTPVLQWRDSNPNVYYYELQLSADGRFDSNPSTASAAVYWLLIHGGVTSPLNSYRIPAEYALKTGETYFWRLRPRVQGDGKAAEWSQAWSFKVGEGGMTAPSPVGTAEPVPSASAAAPPNDPLYPLQWNLDQVNAAPAWSVTKGHPGMAVAVIDTGVDFDHPDLKGRLADGHNCVRPGTRPVDDNGHGTHVAGIIAGLTNNGVGIAGIAPETPIIPIKAVGQDGWGNNACIIDGINFAMNAGAKIINLSLGGTTARALEDSIRQAHARGVLVVASVGNCGSNDAFFDPSCGHKVNPMSYPAGFPSVLSVAATGPEDDHPKYSSSGEHVRIAAPGGNSNLGERTAENAILSTCWRGGYECNHGRDFTLMEGTSMAAPHVAGLAALVWSSKPELTHDQVALVIESSAVDLGAPGRDPYYGAGRIDVLAALRAAGGPVPIPPPLPSPSRTPTRTPVPAATPSIYFGAISFGRTWPTIGSCAPGKGDTEFVGSVKAVFYGTTYQGEGEYHRTWYRDGQILSTTKVTAQGPSGCSISSIQGPVGSILGPGTYTVELSTSDRVGSRASFTVFAPPTPTPTATPFIPTPTATPKPQAPQVSALSFGAQMEDEAACRLGGSGTTFPASAAKVYFRFDYQGAGQFSTAWYRNGATVTASGGPFTLSGASGCSWGYLFEPGGGVLPVGSYRLEVRVEGGMTYSGTFVVEAAAASPTPTPAPATSTPAAVATDTPTATATSVLPTATLTPTATAVAATATATSTATATVSPTATSTASPSATSTAVPTAAPP